MHLQLEKAEAKIQELRQTINDMRANHLKEVVRLKEEVNQSLVNPNMVPDSVSYFQDPKLEVDSLYEEIERLTEATFEMREKHTAIKERMIVYREYAAARTLQATRSKVLLQAAVLKVGYPSVADFVKALPMALLDETIDKEAIAKVLEQEAEEKVRERLAAKSMGIEVIAQDSAPQGWVEEIEEIAIPEAVQELVQQALHPLAPKRRWSTCGEPAAKIASDAGQQETPAPSVSLLTKSASRRENTPVEEEEPAAVTPSSDTDSEREQSVQIYATRTLSPEPEPAQPPPVIKHCVDRGTSPIKELLEPLPVRPSNSCRRVEESKLAARRAADPSQTLRQTAPSSARATAAPAEPKHPAAAVQLAPQAPAAPLAALVNTALPPAMRPRPPQSEMVTALLARTMESSRSPRQPLQVQRFNSEDSVTASSSLPLKRPNPGPKPPKVLPNIVQLGGTSDTINHEALEEWLRTPESPQTAKSLASPRTTMLQPKIRSVEFPEMPTRLF